MAVTGKATAADVQAVHSIIALITDPGAHKARLDELSRHSSLAEQAAADRQASNNALTQANRIKAETEEMLSTRGKALDEREGRVALREQGCAAREAAFNKTSSERDQDLTERERRLVAAERTISERDQKSQDTAARIAAEQQAWADRAKRLNEAVGG